MLADVTEKAPQTKVDPSKWPQVEGRYQGSVTNGAEGRRCNYFTLKPMQPSVYHKLTNQET